MDALRAWGWDEQFATALDALGVPGVEPARVIEAQRTTLQLVGAAGELRGEIAGRLLHDEASALPAVGDWVAVRAHGDRATVQQVLERRSCISRKLPGRATREQVLAANLNTVFMVTSCNEDFNPRRVERYMTMIWESGANPVVLLNKSDLTEDASSVVAEAERVAVGVPVHAVSATCEGGLAALEPHLRIGETIALIGSSGVGKSTIVNVLMGETVQEVRDIRSADGKGRHTTTQRQLFRLPSGALVIDTPGLREIALWVTDSGLTQAFADIEELAVGCRFLDCEHATEPGCAVKRAVEEGSLAADRLASYHKLRKELDYLERKADPESQANASRRWRTIHKNVRAARKKGWLRGGDR